MFWSTVMPGSEIYGAPKSSSKTEQWTFGVSQGNSNPATFSTLTNRINGITSCYALLSAIDLLSVVERAISVELSCSAMIGLQKALSCIFKDKTSLWYYLRHKKDVQTIENYIITITCIYNFFFIYLIWPLFSIKMDSFDSNRLRVYVLKTIHVKRMS